MCVCTEWVRLLSCIHWAAVRHSPFPFVCYKTSHLLADKCVGIGNFQILIAAVAITIICDRLASTRNALQWRAYNTRLRQICIEYQTPAAKKPVYLPQGVSQFLSDFRTQSTKEEPLSSQPQSVISHCTYTPIIYTHNGAQWRDNKPNFIQPADNLVWWLTFWWYLHSEECSEMNIDQVSECLW